MTRLLRNEAQDARSDLEESLERQGDAETLAALVVAGGLGAMKKTETDELWMYVSSLRRSCFTDVCLVGSLKTADDRTCLSPAGGRCHEKGCTIR